jgi:hypothetical protein
MQAAALEQGLFQMPAMSGQVPAIFADAEGDEDDTDEVAALPAGEGEAGDGAPNQAGTLLCQAEVVDD